MSRHGPWSTWSHLAELWWTRHGGMGTADFARSRLTLLVRHARANSPYYRELYADLPPDPPLESLPATDRATLMRHFDAWATDRAITRERVDAFLADRGRVGQPFLDLYRVWKSSGTSGRTGIFVQDEEALAVYDALVAAQLEEVRWSTSAPGRLLASGARSALLVATGDHFASIASWERMRQEAPGRDARAFSVLDPLPQIVAALEEYQPGMIAGYPSVLGLLATEQLAGRLAIAPSLAWCGGEQLRPAARERIARAFGCPVMNEYGASECLSIAHECTAGLQHLHSEWVMLEAVDSRGRPVPPGVASHTTLLTNLANWAQPLIRYDLGDRVTFATGRCACGSPLPAFRLEGRDEAMLALRTARGAPTRLAPLAVTTVIEEVVEDMPFQVAQTAPDRLVLRFAPTEDRRALTLARSRGVKALRQWLRTQGLGRVHVAADSTPPRPHRRSGKIHAVVVEAPRRRAAAA